MEANLRLDELCAIYAQLTVVAAHQSNPRQALSYARTTLDYASRCGEVDFELSARNNIITAEGELGQLLAARMALHDLACFAESVGRPRARAIAQINLAHACRLLGEMAEAIRSANQCMAYFSSTGQRKPLLGALNNASAIAREIGQFALARELRLRLAAGDPDELAESERAMVQVFVAETWSLQGEHERALELLLASMDEFFALQRVQDGEIVLPAAVLRRAGRLNEAREYLERALQRKDNSVYDPAFISDEYARVAAAADDWPLARRQREQANLRFNWHGMRRRIVEDPSLDAGQLFRAPGRTRLQVPDILAEEVPAQ